MTNDEKTGQALGQVLAAWLEFKRTHNLDDPRIQCCEKTQNLFIALELFREAIAESVEDSLRRSG